MLFERNETPLINFVPLRWLSCSALLSTRFLPNDRRKDVCVRRSNRYSFERAQSSIPVPCTRSSSLAIMSTFRQCRIRWIWTNSRLSESQLCSSHNIDTMKWSILIDYRSKIVMRYMLIDTGIPDRSVSPLEGSCQCSVHSYFRDRKHRYESHRCFTSTLPRSSQWRSSSRSPSSIFSGEDSNSRRFSSKTCTWSTQTR